MALTDQAIAKIKDLIVAGEFAPGDRLPKERELAERLGLSRNSLREAVRALSLVGVLEARQGDGTYVTSLEPDLLLAGTSFVSDLLTGPTLRELYEVRRILEPVATALATPRLTDDDFAALEESLERMDTAESTQSFIDADVDFHRVIVNSCGNATLASLIQNLSGGTLRARIWRAIHESDAVESTRRLHHDIYRALQMRDAELAAATDLVHLAAGERWLQAMSEDGAGVQAAAPSAPS
jgi:GntR family transcriptional regulator, transcriptional repressor for pyruvate dehydrogenase complex